MSSNRKHILIAMTAVLLISACQTQPRLPDTNTQIAKLDQESDDQLQKATDQSALREFKRALADMNAGRDEQAKTRLLAMTQAYPLLSGPYANLGIIYFREDKLEEAEQALNKAVQINPMNAMAYNQLGIVYRNTARLDDARRAYELAWQANPNYANTQLNLGILYDLYYDDMEKALQHYERYQKLAGRKDEQVSLWIVEIKQRIKNAQMTNSEESQ